MVFTALMYHSLSDGQHPDTLYPKYSTRLALFKDHLQALRDTGFHLVSCRELLEAHDAKKSLPEKTCVLTFDDGHRSSLEMAAAMQDVGVKGTFFITSGYCRERAEFLRAQEIRELAVAGFEMGAHGVTHRPLAFLPEGEMRDELAQSKQWVEGASGMPVQTMSLPAGQGKKREARVAFSLGYRLVGNSREAANSSFSAPGMMNRFVVLASHSAKDVVKIASASPAYIWKRRLRAAAIWLPKRILRPYSKTRNSN